MNNNSRKRIPISINGGRGIGSLLVLGGVLAVTGLVAVVSFATKKIKAKNGGGGPQEPESDSQEELGHSGSKNEDVTTQGGSLLQNSTATDETECCFTTYETSKLLYSSQHLILDKKLDQKADVEEGIPSCFAQEIVISDDSPPGSATSSNENGARIEECLYDNPCPGRQETEDETSKDHDMNDMESEDVYGNGEENNSEETVRICMDSNEEPIWPAELIEQKQPMSKETLINFQSPRKDLDEAAEEIAHIESSAKINDGNVSDYAGDDRTVTEETTLMEKAMLFVVHKNQLSQFNPLTLTIWIIPVLLLSCCWFLFC